MRRITERDITQAIYSLNRASGIAAPAYNVPGSWQTGWAYGGCQLERVSDGGGVHTFGGYGTKRETLSRILAMLDGVQEIAR